MTLLEQINKIVPETLKAQIKDITAKFNAIPAPIVPIPAPVNLAAIETKLKDGSTLSVDKMEVGGKAQLITEAGIIDAPDAEYEAEDGTKITVVATLVTDIKKVEDPAAAPVAAPDNGMPALMARLDAIESKFNISQTENTNLKTALSSLTDSSKVAFEALNLIVSAPVDKGIEFKFSKKTSGTEKSFDEMSNNEKARSKNGEVIYK